MRRILREIAIRTVEPSLGDEDVWYTFALFPLLERRWHCGNFIYDWHTQYRLARWPVRLWRILFGFRRIFREQPQPSSWPPRHINCRCVIIEKTEDKEGSP